MPQTTTNELEQLRAGHHLRPLKTEEEGTAADRLPAGIYGFAYAPGEHSIPLFGKKTWHSFEMHKRAGGSLYLAGFVTAREAEFVRQDLPGEILLFPDPWEDARELVLVALARAIPSKKGPSREGGNGLKIALL
jgi:hypothetical protein